MDAPPDKQRRYPRVGLQHDMQVAWQAIGGRVVSRIITVGLGGLFISATEPPPVGDVIRLYFEIPGGEIRARAVIRSSIPGEGMGVEFTSMGPEARGRLAQLLKRLMREGADESSKQSTALQL
jgi:PilZ domain